MVILFSSVYFSEAVIVRIKPVRIVSYHRNHTVSKTSSATEIIIPETTAPPTTPSSSSPTPSTKTETQPGPPDTGLTIYKSTRVTSTTLTTSSSPPATIESNVSVTPFTTTTQLVTAADQPNSEAPKTTSAPTSGSLAHIPSARNLTDRAGFFRISPYTRLFYWFFRSKSNSSDPLVVWLQGQPNASSMYGAFDETGPYFINLQTKTLTPREYSWSSSFHVLYLDPYPGCGFSHSENPSEYSQSYKRVVKGILKALRQFFTLYPQLQANSLYLAAQSVGAKYAIVVAHAMLQTVHQYRNLKGVILGGAVIDEYQLANYDSRMSAFGLVDLKMMEDLSQQQDYMAALIRTEAYSRAAEFWHEHVFSFFTRVGYQSPYDARSINVFWDSLVAKYMNQDSVRKELKLGVLRFQPASKAYITSETLRPLQVLIRELLSNIKVIIGIIPFHCILDRVYNPLGQLDSM